MNIVGQVIFVIMLLFLVSCLRVILKIRKTIKLNKNNPNFKGIMVVNGEVSIIEDDKKDSINEVQYVTDLCCEKQIDIQDAYRVVKDGTEYYFCSWECREKFLEGEQDV
ncbi:hypothetical protein AN639_01655 [Candidatus Epulonipiscium fishelsonii]|uniref:Uncharacterized protein n=1 Tax=Candidatus Epulonipiscium fishelsonii TaxID=77094 RepID=A0ACC8XBA5_9FIRM|nr:hypothetical protein AN639_01655 [Epulopiscium sp. SCG-B05WGA-EpuloA1]ONI39693.1 hypothetical protein AN396_07420 [Epulopiscium sp. SCG-B11WGA-EpuloA1]